MNKELAKNKAIDWMAEYIKKIRKIKRIMDLHPNTISKEITICILAGNPEKLEVSLNMGEESYFFKTAEIYQEALPIAEGQIRLF